MPATADFLIETDAKAGAWLEEHPSDAPLVIAFDVKRCCGGGRICTVRFRGQSRKDITDDYVSATMEDGTRLLIDRRAAARLPSRFGLTVRGLGPLRHLDLNLDGEQWGALLYD